MPAAANVTAPRPRSCGAGSRASARSSRSGPRRAAPHARRRRARRPPARRDAGRGRSRASPPGRTTSTFSPAMSAIVGPSQRVCSRPTLVSTWTVDDEHVRRVPAPAEPGLDDSGVDARSGELAVGRRGQRLELRDAVVVPSVRSTSSARRRRCTAAANAPADVRSPTRTRSVNETRCGER